MASHLTFREVIQSNWRLQSVLVADYRRSPSKSSSSGYYASAPILLCNWITNKPIYDASFRLLAASVPARDPPSRSRQLFDGCLQPPSRQRLIRSNIASSFFFSSFRLFPLSYARHADTSTVNRGTST